MPQNSDEIVGQFFSASKDGITRASTLYKKAFFEKNGGYREDYAFCGTIIPNDLLEFDPDDVERLRGHVPEERIDELLDGGEPTEGERQAYRNSIIAQVEDGTADADVLPGYYVYRLRHTDGGEVFAVETVIGYSFTGVENTFHGLFASVEDAEKDLLRWGLVVRS